MAWAQGTRRLHIPPLAHSLVRLINHTAQLQLLAALARLARYGARIAFHLWTYGQPCGRTTRGTSDEAKPEEESTAPALLRTLESLHDTQAVFLLMRD